MLSSGKPKRQRETHRVEKLTVREYVYAMEKMHGIWTRQALLVLALVLGVVGIVLVFLQALGIAHLPLKALLSIISVCTLVIGVVVQAAYRRGSGK